MSFSTMDEEKSMPFEDNLKILKEIGYVGFQLDLSSCGIDTLKKGFLLDSVKEMDQLVLTMLQFPLQPDMQRMFHYH